MLHFSLHPIQFHYPMRLKIIDDIQGIFDQAKNWVTYEMEYAKLTLAEKLTMLFTTLIIGFLCALLAFVVMILLGFALVELFKMIMCPALAFLTVAGILIVLLVILWLVRKPLLLDPLAKMLTRILLDKKNK